MAKHNKAPLIRFTIILNGDLYNQKTVVTRRKAWEVIQEQAWDVELPGISVEGKREVHFYSPTWGTFVVTWEKAE